MENVNVLWGGAENSKRVVGMKEMDGDGSGEVSFVEFYRWCVDGRAVPLAKRAPAGTPP
jgi:hypothetical protein